MKKATSVALCTLLALALAAAARAERYAYPGGDAALFSIEIPDEWTVEPEGAVLHASPPDESIYLGLWALEEGEADDAGAAVERIVSEIVRDFEIEHEDQLEVDRMPLAYFEGHGVDREEDTRVNVAVGIFSPDGRTFCTILYFGSPEAEKTHERALNGIVTSIRRE